MNNISHSESLDYVFLGGGTTGTTTEGFLDAVEAGVLDVGADVRAYAVVGTADDGGATGRQRRHDNLPGLGDVRRSMSALSENSYAAADFERRYTADSTIEDVAHSVDSLLASLSYSDPTLSEDRIAEITAKTIAYGKEFYEKDDKKLAGLALGHLVLAALTLESDIDQAAQEVNKLMHTRAEVIPVSLVSHHLKFRDGDLRNGGEMIYGECRIDDHTTKHPDDNELSLFTEADGSSTGVPLNPRLVDIIKNAHKVVIGPGSVRTSLIPDLLPDGMTEALADKQTVLIGNLVTQDTETRGWNGKKYVQEIERYLGKHVDEVIYNDNTDGIPNAVIYDRDDLLQSGNYKIVGTNIVTDEEVVWDPADELAAQRSKRRHNMHEVTKLMFDSQDTLPAAIPA